MRKVLAMLVVIMFLISNISYADWGNADFHAGFGGHSDFHGGFGGWHHDRGWGRGGFWRGGHWFVDGVVVSIGVGAILWALPPHYKTVYVAGYPYFYDGVYYYRSNTDGSYIIVEPPQISIQPALIEPTYTRTVINGQEYLIAPDGRKFIHGQSGLIEVK